MSSVYPFGGTEADAYVPLVVPREFRIEPDQLQPEPEDDMNIPDYRKSITGRTWAEPWNPITVEHHRRKHHEVVKALFAAGALLLGFAGLGVLMAWRG